jgi:hypothetical protein
MCHIVTLIFWLHKHIFQHSFLLNLWRYITEMQEPVCLHDTTLQISVATSSLLQNGGGGGGGVGGGIHFQSKE